MGYLIRISINFLYFHKFCNYLRYVFSCSALDKIIVQGYKALQLQYFFTAGPDEVKAWTILVRILDYLLHTKILTSTFNSFF